MLIMKLDITNTVTGVPFRVVYLPAQVTSENYPESCCVETGRARVEWYDRRYEHTPDGQFTGARYYPEDLLTTDFGLDLAGGVPDWKINGGAMILVRQWLWHAMGRC